MFTSYNVKMLGSIRRPNKNPVPEKDEWPPTGYVKNSFKRKINS